MKTKRTTIAGEWMNGLNACIERSNSQKALYRLVCYGNDALAKTFRINAIPIELLLFTQELDR